MAEDANEVNEEVQDILIELSQGFWYAGWLANIEDNVLDLLMNPAAYFDMSMSITDKKARELLGSLVRKTLLDGWWPRVDYENDLFFRVPVDRIKNKKNISDADYDKMLSYWDRY